MHPVLKKTQDILFSLRLTKQEVQEMVHQQEAFCDLYPQIKEQLLEKGIHINYEKLMPVSAEHTANEKIVAAESNIAKNATAITKEVQDRTQAISALEVRVNNMIPVTSSVQPVDREQGHIWIEIL